MVDHDVTSQVRIGSPEELYNRDNEEASKAWLRMDTIHSAKFYPPHCPRDGICVWMYNRDHLFNSLSIKRS